MILFFFCSFWVKYVLVDDAQTGRKPTPEYRADRLSDKERRVRQIYLSLSQEARSGEFIMLPQHLALSTLCLSPAAVCHARKKGAPGSR